MMYFPQHYATKKYSEGKSTSPGFALQDHSLVCLLPVLSSRKEAAYYYNDIFPVPTDDFQRTVERKEMSDMWTLDDRSRKVYARDPHAANSFFPCITGTNSCIASVVQAAELETSGHRPENFENFQ